MCACWCVSVSGSVARMYIMCVCVWFVHGAIGCVCAHVPLVSPDTIAFVHKQHEDMTFWVRMKMMHYHLVGCMSLVMMMMTRTCVQTNKHIPFWPYSKWNIPILVNLQDRSISAIHKKRKKKSASCNQHSLRWHSHSTADRRSPWSVEWKTLCLPCVSDRISIVFLSLSLSICFFFLLTLPKSNATLSTQTYTIQHTRSQFRSRAAANTALSFGRNRMRVACALAPTTGNKQRQQHSERQRSNQAEAPGQPTTVIGRFIKRRARTPNGRIILITRAVCCARNY